MVEANLKELSQGKFFFDVALDIPEFVKLNPS